MAETPFRQQEGLRHPVVQELCDWVDAAPERQIYFAEAISVATNKSVADMQDIRCLSEWFGFLDSLLLCVLGESIDATEIFNRVIKLYFVLGQPSIFRYHHTRVPSFRILPKDAWTARRERLPPHPRSHRWQSGGSTGYIGTTLCTNRNNGPRGRSERLRG